MMQNYAKFDSRIAEEAIMQKSMGYNDGLYGNSNGIFNSISYFIGNIFELFLAILAGIAFVFGIFLFIYIIISLFSKGGEKNYNGIKNTFILVC